MDGKRVSPLNSKVAAAATGGKISHSSLAGVREEMQARDDSGRGNKPVSTNMYTVRGKKANAAEREKKEGDRMTRRAEGDRIDERFGFTRHTEVYI